MQKNSHRSTAGRPRAAPQQVRIIGGQWKRTPLAVLAADGLRPTPDRVRETAFNWINHLLDGDWARLHCLDLFAGSGALGFEAASRGAAQVTMVEENAAAVRQLHVVKDKLGAQQVSIVRGDALRLAQGWGGRATDSAAPGARFDLIFVDPPYRQQWLEKVLPLCAPLLAENGLVYVEAEADLAADEAPPWLADWEIVRADRAGMVFYHLLQCKSAQ